jgi:beta-lactam-binding protein with PASTA domain
MKANIRTSFLLNLGIILALCLLLYVAFFATLNCVTRHGEEVRIPDVRGKDINTAISALKALRFDIIIDSTYEPDMKPLTVLKQVPDTGSVVKQGRTVFLTVNMVTPLRIAMPSLVNLSFRSAEMLLRNNKLKLGDTTYKPDIAAGAVLEQLYNGKPIKAGDPIPQGSKISLIIGDGLGNTTLPVPDVTGISVEEAMLILNQYSLQANLIPLDAQTVIADSSAAIVMAQYPAPLNATGEHNTIKAGSIIDLKIK